MSTSKHNPVPSEMGMSRARTQVAHPYLTLMGLYMGGFTGMYSETALNIALPELSKAFHVTTSIAQWLVIGYMLVIGIVLPFSSLLMKWFKAKSITIFALAAFLVGSIISACTPSFTVALLGRAIQGVGTGLVLPMMFALVMEVMPPQKIGAAMGITALVIMFAPAIGPTLAGALMAGLSWRWIFLSFAIFLIIGLVCAALFMVNPYERTRPHIDSLSVLLSVLGFGGLVLGVGMASLYGWLSLPVLASLIIGIVGIVLYSMRQLTSSQPILNLKAFAIQGFRVGAILMMVNFGITLSAMFILPQYYQNGMGIAVALTGMVMLPGGIINALVSMVSGRLFDKIGARKPATIGFALSIIGAGLLLSVSPSSPLAFIVICHIILMIGVPLAMSPTQTYALSSLPHELSTDGSTILNTLQQVLGAVCTAVATSLLVAGQQHYAQAGGTDNALGFSIGSRWGFAFTLVLAIFGFIGTFFIHPLRKDQVPAAVHSREGEPVLRELMKTDVYALPATASAMQAMQLFSEKGISGVPVLDGEQVIGFVSDGDILRMLADQTPQYTSFYSAVMERNSESFTQRLDKAMQTPVADIATRKVISVDINDSMASICQVLVDYHLKKVPVMEQGKMIGMLNRTNILHYVVENYDQQQ